MPPKRGKKTRGRPVVVAGSPLPASDDPTTANDTLSQSATTADNIYSILLDLKHFDEDGSPRSSHNVNVINPSSPGKNSAPVPVNTSTPITNPDFDDTDIKFKLYEPSLTDADSITELKALATANDNFVKKTVHKVIDPLWTSAYTTAHTLLLAMCYTYLNSNGKTLTNLCSKAKSIPCINRFYTDKQGNPDCVKCVSRDGDNSIYWAIAQISNVQTQYKDIEYPKGFHKLSDLELDYAYISTESDNGDTSVSDLQTSVDTSAEGVNTHSPSFCDHDGSESDCANTSATDPRADTEGNTQEEFTTVMPRRSRPPTPDPRSANATRPRANLPTQSRSGTPKQSPHSKKDQTKQNTQNTQGTKLYWTEQARKAFKSYRLANDKLYEEQDKKIGFDLGSKPFAHVIPKTPADRIKLLALTSLGGHPIQLVETPPPSSNDIIHRPRHG